MIVTATGLLLVLLGASIPVGIGLGLLGLILNEMYSPLPLTVMLGELTWSSSNSFIMVAVPFYIMLGEIVLRAGIAERMYNALVQWVSWLPGGLMHSNVAASAMFAAISGSSVATAVTIGTVALDEVKKHRYNERLFLGTLAAGGTLGILIPPSINMVVYGVMTETSIPQLYLAGFIPGFILAGLFSLTVLIACWWRPQWGGDKVRTDWGKRIRSLPDLVPPLIIFLIVIGSIYAGLATATESAALGILGALALAGWKRRLNWAMLRASLEGTIRTTASVMLIILGAYFLNVVINAIGLTAAITSYITSLNLSAVELLLAIVVFYLILGCFMETLSMMVATVPITAPLMIKAGYDPVWYGILVVILMETAMITPPVGINLFVVQGVRGRGQLHDVIFGAAPFVLTMFVMIALVCIFPQLVMWLPNVAR
ncbi:MAG: TRAP transporter large permease [Alphaproteobacteria bacterium]|nr:TRAP transporter large permease [Alphaproteobacteria bacterium]